MPGGCGSDRVKPSHSGITTTGDRETGLNGLIQDFNDTNEWGITVVGEYQGSYNDIFNKMLTFMNTRMFPVSLWLIRTRPQHIR